MDPLDFSRRAVILVVDDTADNLSLMSGLLKDKYKVKLAINGEKALSIARGAEQPDLILLDIMMPGLSGYEVCKILKDDPATRDIPVIFLTAMIGTEDEKKGLELGAADFITKPVNPPIVLARVATQLQINASADHLKPHDRFKFFLDDRTIDMLFKSAPLHDIGKVGIPDRILLKPGRFEPHKMVIMKTHCALRRDAIPISTRLTARQLP